MNFHHDGVTFIQPDVTANMISYYIRDHSDTNQSPNLLQSLKIAHKVEQLLTDALGEIIFKSCN